MIQLVVLFLHFVHFAKFVQLLQWVHQLVAVCGFGGLWQTEESLVRSADVALPFTEGFFDLCGKCAVRCFVSASFVAVANPGRVEVHAHCASWGGAEQW